MRKAFHPLVRAKLRQELRRKHGLSFLDSMRAADDATDDLIDGVVAQQSQELADEFVSGGPVIDRILEFLQSDEGKALIELLIRILIGL